MQKSRKTQNFAFEMAYHILWFANKPSSSNIVNSTLLNLKMCLDMNINYNVLFYSNPGYQGNKLCSVKILRK